MKALALLVLVALSACSHDDKPAQTKPDVAAEPASTAAASASASASSTPADGESGHSACDAVRCRGGMVCKMVNGAPTCVAKD